MNITICFAAKNGDYFERQVEVEKHCTVRIAIERSAILNACSEINLTEHKISVFGRLAKMDDSLHEGDRIEICRPLIIDPKQARLLRVR